jgi:hypothetical protein
MVTVVINVVIRKLVHFISNIFPVFMRRWEIQIFWQEILFAIALVYFLNYEKAPVKQLTGDGHITATAQRNEATGASHICDKFRTSDTQFAIRP